MNVTISVGTRFPAYATTMGRVLLADLRPAELDAYLDRADLCPLTRRTITDADTLRGVLSTVAAQGWALVDQELEEGLRAVAAPIRDRSGRVAAAVNLSTHASRTTLEGMGRDLLPELLATARRIEADLRLAGASAGHAAGHAVTALARSRRHA